jgi:hypothetical protein
LSLNQFYMRYLYICSLTILYILYTCKWFDTFRLHFYVKGPGLLSRYSDSLRAGRFGYRIQLGKRFSATAQNGPGANPASYTMGTGSFPGIKRPRRGVDHPPSSSAEVKEIVELYICSPFGHLCPVLGGTYFYLF